MQWEIVPQTQKEEEVLCKQVKCFPKFNNMGQREGFGRLSFPCFRMLLTPSHNPAADQNDLTKLVVLRWSKTSKKQKQGTFSIELPGIMEHPPMRDVTGRAIKRTRAGVTTTVPDPLAEPAYKPGPKQTYESLEAFEQRLEFLGDTRSEVLNVLSEAVAEYMQAYMSKQAKAAKKQQAA